MFRVGLTGGIGCGKSTVATCFAALDVPLIDTDVIAHQLTAHGGTALSAIRAAFGDDALKTDGTMDRIAMRRRIFSDAKARQQLQAILHPLILQAVQQQLQTLTDVPYVLIVIPLLLETANYRDMVDHILVVDCLETQQIDRVMARNGMSIAEIEAIMSVQIDRTTRLAEADDVLANTDNLTFLHAQITSLHQKYLELARKQL